MAFSQNMIKSTLLLSIVCLLFMSLHAEDSIEQKFYKKLEQAELEYRKDLAQVILKGDKVELSIVKFDGAERGSFVDEDTTVSVSEDRGRTSIISSKILKKTDRTRVLQAFANRLNSLTSNDSGATDCHYPIHGLKIWKGDNLLFDGTFCWKCDNFMFRFPNGTKDFSTNEIMKKLFNKILPVPDSEIQRFRKKYPKTK